MIHKPTKSFGWIDRYVAQVAESDLLEVLVKQQSEVRDFFSRLPAGKHNYRYAEGKWSICEVLGHITDTERIFTYRALCFARGEQTALPGFDENAYVRNARFDRVSLESLADEFYSVRAATIALYRHMDASVLDSEGTANGNILSPRALGYAAAGHAHHHLLVIRERYM